MSVGNRAKEIGMRNLSWLVGIGLGVASYSATADVKLPAVFSDNMVLQRMEKAPFFGTADKGEKVTVKVGQASAEATAGDDGKWRATLDTRELRGPVEVSVAGNNSIAIK